MKPNYFDLNVAALQDFNSWPHSPAFKTFNLIKQNSVVLDVGCSKGHMARELSKKNCKVSGIELDFSCANEAKKYCDKVVSGNIEIMDSFPFNESYFDYIILLDVLEHLIYPEKTLIKLKPYLKDSGKIIASIPNIARIEHRLNLILGKFNYSDGGALSKGHLRFFTLKTAEELITSVGYSVKQVIPTGFGSIIKIFPSLFAYQFLFIAEKS